MGQRATRRVCQAAWPPPSVACLHCSTLTTSPAVPPLRRWVEQRAGDHRLTTLGKQAPAGGGGGKNGGPAGKKVKT